MQTDHSSSNTRVLKKFMRRIPETSRTLVLELHSFPETSDSGFQLLGVSREELVNTFLKELGAYKYPENFKNYFKKDIEEAIKKGWLQVKAGADAFDAYLQQLKMDLPLSASCAMRYARLKGISLYLWKTREPVITDLFLFERCYFRSSTRPAIHALISPNGNCHRLVDTNSPEEKEEKSVGDNVPAGHINDAKDKQEWEEAKRLAGITDSPHESISTLFSQNTPLPSPLISLVEKYAEPLTLEECIKEEHGFNFGEKDSQESNTRDIDPGAEDFWEKVVGNFSMFECYPYSHRIKGAPSLSLLVDKLHKGHSLFSLEVWTYAILNHIAKQQSGKLDKDSANDIKEEDDEQDEFDYFLGDGNSFLALKREDGNRDFGASHLVLLQQKLFTSKSLAAVLLTDEECAFIVRHYPRLQGVFLGALLSDPQPQADPIIVQIKTWLPDDPQNPTTLSPFQVLRTINSILLTTELTPLDLQKIEPIKKFLDTRGFTLSKDKVGFIQTVCDRAHEFLGREVVIPEEGKPNTIVTVPVEDTSKKLHASFREYCLSEKSIPDWYVVSQYVLAGVTVTADIFRDAVMSNYLQTVKLFVQIPDIDANAHVRGVTGCPADDTYLMIASLEGHYEIVRVLLAQAEVNPQRSCFSQQQYEDASDHTALALAAWGGDADVVNLLLMCPGTDVFRKNTINTMLNYKHEDYTTLQLAYQYNNYEVIKSLFRSPAMSKLSSEEFEKQFQSRNVFREAQDDLRTVAASIAHDLTRCASIVLKLMYHNERIRAFLLQIPSIDANEAFKEAGRRHYSGNKLQTFTALLSLPGIKGESVHAALANLTQDYSDTRYLEASERKRRPKNRVRPNSQDELYDDFDVSDCNYVPSDIDFNVAKLLLAHPGVDINQKYLNPEQRMMMNYPQEMRGRPPIKEQSFLQNALCHPRLARLLLSHPRLDVNEVCFLLTSRLEQRKALVKQYLLPELRAVPIAPPPPRYPERDFLFDGDFEETEDDSKETQEIDESANALISESDEVMAGFEETLLSPGPAFQMRLPLNMTVEKKEAIWEIFWVALRTQERLHREMTLLLEAPSLRFEHLHPLLEQATQAKFIDVIDILLNAPCMQSHAHCFMDTQEDKITDEDISRTHLNTVYQQFTTTGFSIKKEHAAFALAEMQLRHAIGSSEVTPLVLGYINGRSISDNNVYVFLGAAYLNAGNVCSSSMILDSHLIEDLLSPEPNPTEEKRDTPELEFEALKAPVIKGITTFQPERSSILQPETQHPEIIENTEDEEGIVYYYHV